MGPGTGLIVGIPFALLAISLLVIFRRERRRREAGTDGPNAWLPLYRLIALAVVLFIGYLVVALVELALNPPPSN